MGAFASHAVPVGWISATGVITAVTVDASAHPGSSRRPQGQAGPASFERSLVARNGIYRSKCRSCDRAEVMFHVEFQITLNMSTRDAPVKDRGSDHHRGKTFCGRASLDWSLQEVVHRGRKWPEAKGSRDGKLVLCCCQKGQMCHVDALWMRFVVTWLRLRGRRGSSIMAVLTCKRESLVINSRGIWACLHDWSATLVPATSSKNLRTEIHGLELPQTFYGIWWV